MWVTLPLLIYFYECRLPCHHWCVVSKCRFSCLDWYVMTWNANYIAIIEILLNKLQIILPSLIYRYLFDECGLPFHEIFWESGLPCHCWYIVNKMQISLHVIFYGWMRIPCDHRYFTSGSGLPCHPRYFINDCRMPCHHRYFMSGSGLPCHPRYFINKCRMPAIIDTYFMNECKLPCHPRSFMNECGMPCHHGHFMKNMWIALPS